MCLLAEDCEFVKGYGCIGYSLLKLVVFDVAGKRIWHCLLVLFLEAVYVLFSAFIGLLNSLADLVNSSIDACPYLCKRIQCLALRKLDLSLTLL
jgi:hypothetical protein